MIQSEFSRTINKCNRGTKRKSNVENWKDNKNKRLRNSGNAYETRKSKSIPAKKAPEEICDCRCNFFCKNFSVSQITEHFYKFYEKTYNEQSALLSSLIELMEPKRRRKGGEGICLRNCTVNYFLPSQKGKRERVCKKMICHTFQVTQRRIQMLVEKLKNGLNTNDQRGKHNNRPHKIVDEEKKSVMEHIISFPSQESHYSRSSSKNDCLSPDLNINAMYNLYKVKYPDTSISYNTYREIFNKEHNLRFGFPRSDTCKVCDKFFIQMVEAANSKRLDSIVKSAKEHHEKAEKGYAQLRDDSNGAVNSDNIVVICVDLQQVIFTPNLTHSDVFYQRQYSNYNFAVHTLPCNKVDMYTWHETVAKRGASEIASCILKHISCHYRMLKKGEFRKLIIWSDRCVGQNNNWTIISLCHSVLSKYFSEINQKFLTSGHSFLPCDRDFALIEKKKKTSQLFIPEDVCHLIESTRQSNPFNVHQMGLSDFKNFEVLNKNLYKDPNCKITEARWLQISIDDPDILRVRKNHSIAETWVCYKLNSKRTRNLANYTMAVLRKEPIKISDEKKKDLLAMASYLPEKRSTLIFINLSAINLSEITSLSSRSNQHISFKFLIYFLLCYYIMLFGCEIEFKFLL